MDRTAWLDPSDLEALRAAGAQRRLPAGSFLFFEGDDPAAVLLVERGTVKITTTSIDGHEVVLALAEDGEFLGELSAVDGSPRSASAIALTDVALCSIPAKAFAEFLESRPKAAMGFASLLAGRLRNANRRQLEYAGADALGRLCARLDELRERQDAPCQPEVSIVLPMNQTELGNWAGLSREAVVKGLRTLRTLGWITTEAKTVHFHEPAQIRARGSM